MSKKSTGTIHKNICYIREKLGLTQTKFAELVNEYLTSNGEEKRVNLKNIGSYERGGGVPDEVKLAIRDLYNAEYCPDTPITIDDLIEGDIGILQKTKRDKQPEGTPLATQTKILPIVTDDKGNERISFVDGEDVKIAAGYLTGHTSTEFISSLPNFALPFIPQDGTYRAFCITGHSMMPTPSGSIVIGRYVDEVAKLRNNNTYVIVTQEGIVYKRVINQLEDAGVLLLLSDNKEFEPYAIKRTEIREVWKVVYIVIPNDKWSNFNQ